jgi:hypothetical protein
VVRERGGKENEGDILKTKNLKLLSFTTVDIKF